MFDVEMKLVRLRDTPYSGTAVDEEIDNDIEYWQRVHDELFAMFKSKGYYSSKKTEACNLETRVSYQQR